MKSMNNAVSTLKLAGLEVCHLENEQYKRFESAEVSVPKRVDINIKKLIAAHIKKASIKESFIKISCIALSILVISTAVLAINVEARDRLRKLIRQVFGTNIDYVPNTDVSEEGPQYVIKDVVVGWIPDGFECVDVYNNKNGVSIHYKGDNTSIFIECFLNNGDVFLVYTSPEETSVKSEIGEYKGNYYEFIHVNEFSRTNNLLVIDKSENYGIAIDSSLEKDILFKIYDSLIVFIE